MSHSIKKSHGFIKVVTSNCLFVLNSALTPIAAVSLVSTVSHQFPKAVQQWVVAFYNVLFYWTVEIGSSNHVLLWLSDSTVYFLQNIKAFMRSGLKAVMLVMILLCNGSDAGMDEEGGFELQATNLFVCAADDWYGVQSCFVPLEVWPIVASATRRWTSVNSKLV